MKRLVLILAFSATASASPAGPAFAGIGAIQSESYGKTSRIVEIRGERGEPQPAEWTFLLSDPKARGGVREVTVAGGKITSERTPLRGMAEVASMPPLDTKSLSCDADKVFQTVQSETRKSQLGFHWIDYTLRTDAQSGAPVWDVKLFDYMGAPVASMKVSAAGGSVVSPLRADSPAYVEPAKKTGQLGGLAGDVSTAAGRAAKSTKDSTLHFIGSLQEAVTGERTIGPKDDE